MTYATIPVSNMKGFEDLFIYGAGEYARINRSDFHWKIFSDEALTKEVDETSSNRVYYAPVWNKVENARYILMLDTFCQNRFNDLDALFCMTKKLGNFSSHLSYTCFEIKTLTEKTKKT